MTSRITIHQKKKKSRGFLLNTDKKGWIRRNWPGISGRNVLHNPETQAYCVLVWDGKELKLVSWNNAGDDYGNSEWALK